MKNKLIIMGVNFRTDGVYVFTQNKKKKGWNSILADDSYEISYFLYWFKKKESELIVYNAIMGGDFIGILSPNTKSNMERGDSNLIKNISIVRNDKITYQTPNGHTIQLFSHSDSNELIEESDYLKEKGEDFRKYVFINYPPVWYNQFGYE